MAPNVQVHLLASIWVDLLAYGLYVPFFMAAVYILVAKPTSNRIPSLVFLLTNIAIFILLTIHIVVNCYRLIRAYGFVLGPNGTPLSYIQDAKRWDNWAHTVLMVVVPWFGTALFNYRVFLVWGGNYLVVALPILLWFANTAINCTLLHWFKTQFTTYPKILPVIDSTYPLKFAQNLLITGLIGYKMWRQHKADLAAGEKTSSGFTLFMRIFWDSAALYTLELLVMLPLYYEGHPGQFVLQAGLFPTIGVITSIMAIRVHLPQSRTVLADATNDVPAWLDEKNADRHSQASSKKPLKA